VVVAFLATTAAIALSSAPAAEAKRGSGARTPRVPRIPEDFSGRGRYIVSDLGVNVPFTWEGRDGNSQMVAGGNGHPIWFTNLIYENTLYTLTYKWPNIPPDHPCGAIPGVNLDSLNQLLGTSHFVGREILQQRARRRVNHWRLSVVGGFTQPGEFPRFPIGQADIYAQRGNPSRIWQVLHFGFQNLFDPDLDEWIRMRSFRHRPGEVELPSRCPPPA
jgi:hypothetical protein